MTVKDNTVLGDDKNSDVLDVNAKTNFHGDTTIGDNSGDTLVVNATSEFKADATFDKDLHAKGNAEIDKDLSVHGSETVDGKLHVKDDADFGKDVTVHGELKLDKGLSVSGDSLVNGNQAIEKNLSVGGDAVVNGDIYGRSFNIGNERYIDANGINANGHKIRNVADGDIGPNSLDAVNGRQLYTVKEDLSNNIGQVGAQSAAMANLHPLEFEYEDKVSISAAVGGYKDNTALAVGVFYRPDSKSIVSISGALGSDSNMYGVGFSQKLGRESEFQNMNENQLKDALSKLSEDAKEIKAENKTFKAENDELTKQLAANEKADKATEAANKAEQQKLADKLVQTEGKLAETEKEVSTLRKAYNDLKTQLADLVASIKGEA